MNPSLVRELTKGRKNVGAADVALALCDVKSLIGDLSGFLTLPRASTHVLDHQVSVVGNLLQRN